MGEEVAGTSCGTGESEGGERSEVVLGAALLLMGVDSASSCSDGHSLSCVVACTLLSRSFNAFSASCLQHEANVTMRCVYVVAMLTRGQ